MPGTRNSSIGTCVKVAQRHEYEYKSTDRYCSSFELFTKKRASNQTAHPARTVPCVRVSGNNAQAVGTSLGGSATDVASLMNFAFSVRGQSRAQHYVRTRILRAVHNGPDVGFV